MPCPKDVLALARLGDEANGQVHYLALMQVKQRDDWTGGWRSKMGCADGARESAVMSAASTTNPWIHSNRYSADSACEHCEGIVRHEPWCITRSAETLYAYEAVLDAGKLTVGDRLILHALGASWIDNACQGACKAAKAR